MIWNQAATASCSNGFVDFGIMFPVAIKVSRSYQRLVLGDSSGVNPQSVDNTSFTDSCSRLEWAVDNVEAAVAPVADTRVQRTSAALLRPTGDPTPIATACSAALVQLGTSALGENHAELNKERCF